MNSRAFTFAAILAAAALQLPAVGAAQ